jgi:DNA-binding IclR family transcriptional regulator
MAPDDTPVLQSSQKQFNILEQLTQADGAGITELSEATSLPKSTVHLHLQSLIEAGYVVKSGREYTPSLKLLRMGEQTRESVELYREGREEIDSLARETNELVNLGLFENGKVRLLYLRETHGDRPTESPSVSTEFEATRQRVSVLSEDYGHAPGTALDIHATAMGKAILAALSRETVERIIDEHGLPRHTEQTITSYEELFAELEAIRTRGYAEDVEGRAENLYCVAAAVSNNDEPIGAVSITGISDQWNGEYQERLADKIMDTARMIEIKLAHS